VNKEQNEQLSKLIRKLIQTQDIVTSTLSDSTKSNACVADAIVVRDDACQAIVAFVDSLLATETAALRNALAEIQIAAYGCRYDPDPLSHIAKVADAALEQQAAAHPQHKENNE